MEAKPLKDSGNEVAESLDVRVVNRPAELLPSTNFNSSQTPSTANTTTSELVTSNTGIRTTPHLPSKDALTYELEKFTENRMIIFSHDTFSDGTTRIGTSKDEKILRDTFKKFRFTIATYQNLKRTELIETIEKFALEPQLSTYGCICVAILTHSHDEPGYIRAFDQHYSEFEILKHFDASKNYALAGKPIVFIIQACRKLRATPHSSGGENDVKNQMDTDRGTDSYNQPTEADRVVFNSSYIHYDPISHQERGSWCIQALCKKINECALTHDLETIFQLVIREVCQEIRKANESHNFMPVVVSTTTLREIHLALNLDEKEQARQRAPSEDNEHSISDQLSESVNEHMTLVAARDAPPTLMQPAHLPCYCFLEYFEYLKNCLKSFCVHSPEDSARNLLKMVEDAGDGAEYNTQKFNLIHTMLEYFQANESEFPTEGFPLVHRMYC